MIYLPYRGTWPDIHPSALAADNVSIIGDVTIQENVNLWYGVIARGDVAPIVIGANTNIQDGCLIHDKAGIPAIIGKNVTAGHGAILHGCTVGDNCLIGMGAILLNGSVIGEGSIVAAGTLVTERTVIPPGSMVMGSPGKIVRTVRPDELENTLRNADKYVKLAEEQLRRIHDILRNNHHDSFPSEH